MGLVSALIYTDSCVTNLDWVYHIMKSIMQHKICICKFQIANGGRIQNCIRDVLEYRTVNVIMVMMSFILCNLVHRRLNTPPTYKQQCCFQSQPPPGLQPCWATLFTAKILQCIHAHRITASCLDMLPQDRHTDMTCCFSAHVRKTFCN